MTVGKLTQPYRGRRGSPSVIELRFWTDATKTVGRDMTAISSTWLAELRANPTDTTAAGTWSIDASAAAGSTGVPGVLTLSLDSDGVTALLGGRGERTFGWDLFALDTDTPIVTGTYIVDDAYTHPSGGASPSASTPLGIYDITVLGGTTTNLTEVDVITGAEGPQGVPGAPGAAVNIDDTSTGSTTSTYSSSKQLTKFAPAGSTSPNAFGVAADGVTDDSTAINAMSSSTQLRFGGVALLKKPLILKTQQQIEGLGRFASQIKFDPTAFSASVALPAVTSITADGTFYTVTFTSAHGRSLDDVIELFGATPDAWNDIFQVVNVVSSTVLKVKCPLSPSAPSTQPSARTINALIIFGSAAALVFGTRLSNLTIDCQSIPDAVAVFGEYASLNEMSGVVDCLITNCTYRGARIKAAQYQWDSNEVYLQPALTQTTSIASGSNGVDLNGAAFLAGTAVINIPAGDLAAQQIPWAGSAVIAVTGGAGFRPVFYRGVSAGTGPSGQDQLLNVQTGVNVSRVMATGIAVTVQSAIGLDLTVPGGALGAGSTLKLHRSTIVGGTGGKLRAAVRVNGGGSCVIDGFHTENATAGLIVGDKAGAKALTTIGFSRANSGMIGIAVLKPADGSTNDAFTFIGTSVDGGYATIVDIPKSTVISNSPSPSTAQYPIPLTGSQPLAMYKQIISAITPSATVNTPGAPVTFSPDGGKTSIMPMFARYQATTIGAETVTVNLVANYADSTSSSAVVATATNGSLFSPLDTQFPNLWKDGTYITSLTATVQSSISSSTAQVQAIVVGFCV